MVAHKGLRIGSGGDIDRPGLRDRTVLILGTACLLLPDVDYNKMIDLNFMKVHNITQSE